MLPKTTLHNIQHLYAFLSNIKSVLIVMYYLYSLVFQDYFQFKICIRVGTFICVLQWDTTIAFSVLYIIIKDETAQPKLV